MADDAQLPGTGLPSGLESLFQDPSHGREAIAAVLNTTPNAVLIADHEGRVMAVNAVFSGYFGFTPDEHVASTLAEVVDRLAAAAEDPRQLRDVMAAVDPSSAPDPDRAAATSVDATVRFARPAEVVMLISAAAVRYAPDRELGVVFSFTDVTSMHRSEARLRTLADASPIPLIISRFDDGMILYCNDELAAVVNSTPKQLLGRRAPDFYYDSGDREAVLRILEDTGEVQGREVRIRRPDGSVRWTLLSMVRAQLSGETVIIGGLYDITDRKLAEQALERANQELLDAQGKLLRSEKMASLGMLVAGIAHEINTPIGAVGSMHDTLVRGTSKLNKLLDEALPGGLAGQPKITKVLGIIEDANRVIADGTGRVTNIVRRLKSFARLDEAELKEASLNDGLDDTLTLIQHEFKRGLELDKDFGALPPVACFPGRLNQVFLNLLMNAKQAMPDGGKIRVKTWADEGYVYASISDTGVGISQEHLRRIFDPGFTTKGVGVGTGLGLSICYQIVQEHFGELLVDSELGQGSTFTVKIPLDVESKHEARKAKLRAAEAEPEG